jgi:DNA ligase-1
MFWDGGFTRGMLCSEVPFANTAKDKKEKIATGLWSRGGKAIQAPKWFLDQLPNRPLDGEGWLGRGRFQEVGSILRTDIPNELAWKSIKFMVFDSPSLQRFATPGRIHVRGWETEFTEKLWEWIKEKSKGIDSYGPSVTFETIYPELKSFGPVNVVQQERLSGNSAAASKRMAEIYSEAVENGAEGVMLRNPASIWRPERNNDMLKVKPKDDAEGEVIGYMSGKVTEKDSRNLGRMGALILKDDSGRIFSISGFKDSEREFSSDNARIFALANPDSAMPDHFENAKFPRGTRVTFTYIGRTDDGIPKHANYKRKRVDF